MGIINALPLFLEKDALNHAFFRPFLRFKGYMMVLTHSNTHCNFSLHFLLCKTNKQLLLWKQKGALSIICQQLYVPLHFTEKQDGFKRPYLFSSPLETQVELADANAQIKELLLANSTGK